MKRSCTFFLILSMWCGSAISAPIPWPEGSYSRFSNGEDLRIVLYDLARLGGFMISVSDQVEGEVNGSFDASTYSQSFDVLARMFSLISYFDGSVLWVSTFDEMESNAIQLKSISVRSFEKKLVDLGIKDAGWSWRSLESERIVYVTGPARYVELVSQMATKFDRKKKIRSGIVYSQVDKNGVTMLSDKPFSKAK